MHPQDAYPPAPRPDQRSQPRMTKPNPYDPLFLYKIGLAVIGLFTLGITIFALVSASAAKQDAKTEKAANSVATTLDTYITVNQKVPDSLAAAGVHEDTSHIKYTKLSSSSYKFCITYKTASSTTTNPIDDLTGRNLYKRLAVESYGSGDNSYLYINPVHKKGENCQTVKPPIGDYLYDSSSSSSDSSDYQSDLGSASDPADAKANAQDAAKTDEICYLSGYQTHYSGTITAVTDTNGKQSDGMAGQDEDIKLKVQPDGSSPAGEQTFTVKANDTSAFSNGCISMYGSSFKAGDHVAIFTQNKDNFMPDVIVDYSAE